MTFVLTEEQDSIQRTARELSRERATVALLRRLRDERDTVGYGQELWRELAELGFVGISVPERYGGAGLGHRELGLVLEELGRGLAPTPFVSTVALGANALLLGDDEAAREALLPGVCSGERVLAVAADEGSRYAPGAIASTVRDGKLYGHKSFVLDGHVARQLLVVAREREALGLFLVAGDDPAIRRQRLTLVDSRNAAALDLDGAEVLGRIGGRAAIDGALDRATVALCAEMLGGAREVFDRTLAYLKTREQFGRPIGSFQALQHRATSIFCELELTISIVAHAAAAIDAAADDDDPELPLLVSAAKARANDAFLLAASEAIQMHGGVGVTDELDIGLYYKRAQVSALTLGSSSYHRDRYARLSGY